MPQQTLDVRRDLAIAGRLYHQTQLSNFLRDPVTISARRSRWRPTSPTCSRSAGLPRARPRACARPKEHSIAGSRFAYVGEDEEFRETVVEFDPQPDELVASRPSAPDVELGGELRARARHARSW